MITRRVVFGALALALVFMVGCGKKVQAPKGMSSQKAKECIEKAKQDFLSGDKVGIGDFATGVIEMMSDDPNPGRGDFENCRVTKAKVFDYFKSSYSGSAWAVELEFVGTLRKTKEEKQGIAILQYYPASRDGGKMQDELMFLHTALTDQGISQIRMTAKKSFDGMRKMDRQARGLGLGKP